MFVVYLIRYSDSERFLERAALAKKTTVFGFFQAI